MRWSFVLIPFLFACSPESEIEDGTCSSMCDELQGACAYDAFPDVESCLEGCLYSESEGADIEAQLACILQAECDTFEILECENQHGVISNE